MNKQETLKWFIGLIEEADVNNDQHFWEVICCVPHIFELSPKDIVHKFGMSIPSVMRWIKGTTAPASAMRKPVLNAFLVMAKDKLASEKD